LTSLAKNNSKKNKNKIHDLLVEELFH